MLSELWDGEAGRRDREHSGRPREPRALAAPLTRSDDARNMASPPLRGAAAATWTILINDSLLWFEWPAEVCQTEPHSAVSASRDTEGRSRLRRETRLRDAAGRPRVAAVVDLLGVARALAEVAAGGRRAGGGCGGRRVHHAARCHERGEQSRGQHGGWCRLSAHDCPAGMQTGCESPGHAAVRTAGRMTGWVTKRGSLRPGY